MIKTGEHEYEMRIASSEVSLEKTPYLRSYQHKLSSGEEITVHVTGGDFPQILAKVVESLEQSYHYVANENQKNMIRDYVEHFRFGE